MNRFKNILLDADSIKQATKNHMKGYGLAAAMATIGLMLVFTAHAQNQDRAAQPTVFQAAGPNASSIQGTVEQFRLALGGINNGVTTAPPATPLTTGRREINWDGGSPTNTATSLGPTPLDQFLSGRGTRFTTGGGFIQATPKGLADFFGNPSYETIFKTFSPARLFSPIGSNVTETFFFVPSGVPGVIGAPATTRGFGVVFSDVDLPGGSISTINRGHRPQSTLIEYFSADGQLLFSSFAPASPGDGNLTFFGVVFDDARIASVRITTGAPPGPDDSRAQDVVMMDDFIYGEPQRIQ